MRGEGSTRPGDKLVEASVCCTERIVWASADSAAAWKETFIFKLNDLALVSIYEKKYHLSIHLPFLF